MSDDRSLESRWMDRTSGGMGRLAAECLEKQIDAASQGVASDFSGVMKAVHLVIEEAKREIRAELAPDAVLSRIHSMERVVNALCARTSVLVEPGHTPEPAPPSEPEPEPAPPAIQWEVFLTYMDINSSPTGNEARIGLYWSEADAHHVAELLNKLTGHAYVFDHKQV